MFWLAIFALLIIYIVLNLGLIASRNHKAHKFFSEKSPKLPVLPNPNIFYGHIQSLLHRDKNWKIITELHEKYGPTFGYYAADQPWVSTKDLDLIKLIEVDQAQKHVNRANLHAPFTEFNNSIFQVVDDDWRRIRRAVAPALTNHKVRSEEASGDIEFIISKLKASLELKMDKGERETGKRSCVVELNDTFKRYALAVIFLLTYKQDNVIDFNSKVDKWQKTIDIGSRAIGNPLLTIHAAFPFMRPLCRRLIAFSQLAKCQLKIIDYIVEATNINQTARKLHEQREKKLTSETGAKQCPFSELKSQGRFKRRLVDTIIDAFIDKKINYDDFIGTTLFLLVAGFESASDTIMCLIWHLAHKPDIQDKLRKTIQEEGIDADYVMWCINETVRWYPAVPLGTGRIVSEDVTVNGLLIPKGTFVMPSTHSIHHDSSIWPEADEFKPERWANSAKFHPAAFMGFGLGPRNCVGSKLAIHEIKLVMQMLLTNYRIEVCPETSPHFSFSSPGLFFTLIDQEIKVRFVELPGVLGNIIDTNN